ncbi:MAG: L-threonylcarbamoyladenylate synthase, partial [Clostridiales bacterium]|nr:L-threonylcarbamoyladenylate synthase [Clostridiales bacterium]
RPSDNPMIMHIARASDIGQLTPAISQTAVSLIDSFWPGPLTLVVWKRPEVPDAATGGLGTVAVRMPDDAAALALIREAGCPVAAPSANLSGRPSPTKPSHVLDDLSGKIDAIILGGECRVGIESTVLDVTGETPTVLRPGVVTAEDIEAVIGCRVELDPTLLGFDPAHPMKGVFGEHDTVAFTPKAPGMKYRHYAPRAEMAVIEGLPSKVRSEIERIKAANERIGNRVGVVLFEEKAFREAAHDFFAKLREMDSEEVDLILAGALSDTDGVGFAVMNRMLKSAGYNIIKV